MIAGFLFGAFMRWRLWSLILAIVGPAMIWYYGSRILTMIVNAPTTATWWFIGSCVGTAVSLTRRWFRHRRDKREAEAAGPIPRGSDPFDFKSYRKSADV